MKNQTLDIPRKVKNLIGQTYRRLTVIDFAGIDKWGNALWFCDCSCGGKKVVQGRYLEKGTTSSCGCLYVGAKVTHGKTKTPEYYIWDNMLRRCKNPKNPTYKNYGGRGISVCKLWHKFENFFKDMGKCPPGLTLERRNNNLGYCPDNCIWATWATQNNNQRPKSCGPCKQQRFIAGHIKSRKIFRSDNQSGFARKHKLIQSAISACLRGAQTSHKGWKFKWAKTEY
jgi:hypothetical protein